MTRCNFDDGDCARALLPFKASCPAEDSTTLAGAVDGGEAGTQDTTVMVIVTAALVLCGICACAGVVWHRSRKGGGDRVHPSDPNPQMESNEVKTTTLRATATENPGVEIKNPNPQNPIKNPMDFKSFETTDLPSQGWAAQPVDGAALGCLRELFAVRSPQELGKGRDAQAYGRAYNRLEVHCAWRLMHPVQWMKYSAARMSVQMHMDQLRRQGIALPSWTSKLESIEAAAQLPDPLSPQAGWLLRGGPGL